MPPCGRYLIRGMPANLTLYYLVTISISVTSILTAFTALISLFLCPFSNSFAFDLFDRRIEIDPFLEYDIFIVFIVWGTLSIRLIFMFNSSIRSASDILSDPPYLVNMNLFEIFVFFTSFFSTVFSFFYIVFYWFWFYSGVYVITIYI